MNSSTSKQKIATIAGVNVYKMDDDGTVVYKAGMEIDADGSPHAYHPISSKGLDSLENAKDGHGKYVGIVVNHNGEPVVQGENAPAPGFFVSTTALQDPSKALTDPARYVNAAYTPYVVLPGGMLGGAMLGDFAVLIDTSGDSPPCFAICADTGPTRKLGEASIAAAEQLGIPSSPKTGGTEAKVVQYVVFAGSGNGKPRSLYEISVEGARLFAERGGMERFAKICS